MWLKQRKRLFAITGRQYKQKVGIITLRAALVCIAVGPVCGFVTAGGRCLHLTTASARVFFSVYVSLSVFSLEKRSGVGNGSSRIQVQLEKMETAAQDRMDGEKWSVDMLYLDRQGISKSRKDCKSEKALVRVQTSAKAGRNLLSIVHSHYLWTWMQNS